MEGRCSAASLRTWGHGYKATRVPENTVQWEEKDQTERRISSKDTENRTGSRVSRTTDRKTWQFMR